MERKSQTGTSFKGTQQKQQFGGKAGSNGRPLNPQKEKIHAGQQNKYQHGGEQHGRYQDKDKK